MARFSLVEGDVTVLTMAFNALRQGTGTHLLAGLTLDAFLQAWKISPTVFASDLGLFGLSMENNPQGAATAILCQFQPETVNVGFGQDVHKLSRELLKAMNLVVIRAMAGTEQADQLFTLAGFTREGVLRCLSPDEHGVLQDISIYSLTKDDLEARAETPSNKEAVEAKEHVDLHTG